MAPTRSVAKADVAELSAALDSAVDAEKAHHLVIVSTNKVLSTTQFKQMFYSRGDDFFQIANVYECPDSCNSVHSSVWGIDCQDPHNSAADNVTGLVSMGHDRLAGSGGVGGANDYKCYNFNKLGGRENDPKGCAWAYSYVHDQSRNFYAQHEVMGYLEKDTCVKRDFWTACSRMSIEDQLYGLAFASETDQDLCMAVTCARRWSEVEDALAESCTAADREIACPDEWNLRFTAKVHLFNCAAAPGGNAIALPANSTITFSGVPTGSPPLWEFTSATLLCTSEELEAAIQDTASTTGVFDPINGTTWTNSAGHTIKMPPGWTMGPAADFVTVWRYYNGTIWTTVANWATLDAMNPFPAYDTAYSLFRIPIIVDGCHPGAMSTFTGLEGIIQSVVDMLEHGDLDDSGKWTTIKELDDTARPWQDDTDPNENSDKQKRLAIKANHIIKPQYIDLYINVRVSNGHPKALDTLLRVRFTVAYVLHEPSALHTWNIRASTAAAGVIQSGVVGDAPEGGKEQHEDTTVVVA